MKMYVFGGDGHMVSEIRGFGAEKSGQRPEGSQDVNCELIEAMHAAVPELVRDAASCRMHELAAQKALLLAHAERDELKKRCDDADHLEYQLKEARDEIAKLEADAERYKAAAQAWVDRDVAREQLLHSLKPRCQAQVGGNRRGDPCPCDIALPCPIHKDAP